MPLPPPSPPSRTELLHAYRRLYKGALRAVQYSQPARTVARDRIRNAFRPRPSSPPPTPAPHHPAAQQSHRFDASRVQRTIEFLDNAARTKGLEHRLMKNLVQVWYWRDRLRYHMTLARKDQFAQRKVAYEEFDRTVAKLNETMGLCI